MLLLLLLLMLDGCRRCKRCLSWCKLLLFVWHERELLWRRNKLLWILLLILRKLLLLWLLLDVMLLMIRWQRCRVTRIEVMVEHRAASAKSDSGSMIELAAKVRRGHGRRRTRQRVEERIVGGRLTERTAQRIAHVVAARTLLLRHGPIHHRTHYSRCPINVDEGYQIGGRRRCAPLRRR